MLQFRLKSSGLNRPIYLIEEFGNSRQNLGFPEASMMQSVANTLMIEKFQVHWTNGSKDSIAFLVEMTKQCIKMYQVSLTTNTLDVSINYLLKYLSFINFLGENSH